MGSAGAVRLRVLMNSVSIGGRRFFIVPRHLFTAVFNFVQKLCTGIFVNVLVTFLMQIQSHGYNTSVSGAGSSSESGFHVE